MRPSRIIEEYVFPSVAERGAITIELRCDAEGVPEVVVFLARGERSAAEPIFVCWVEDYLRVGELLSSLVRRRERAWRGLCPDHGFFERAREDGGDTFLGCPACAASPPAPAEEHDASTRLVAVSEVDE